MEAHTKVVENMRTAQEGLLKKVSVLTQQQEDLRQEQQDLKEHILNRLDDIDEKTAWFLSKGQQGTHPLSDRISQIEEKQNTTLALIKHLLDVSPSMVY